MPFRPPVHNPTPWRKKESKPFAGFYGSKEWKEFKNIVLKERKYKCSHPGCLSTANSVDHITSLRSGGAKLDRANVAALCWSHHSKKTAAIDTQRNDDGQFIRY